MEILGFIVLLLAIVAIYLMMYAGLDIALRDREEERIEELAEKRFNEMVDNAEIHVVQRLEIVDRMKK